MPPAPPSGYVAITEDGVYAVARSELADAVRQAIVDAGSLYDFAADAPDARLMSGRGTAFAVTLPGSAIPVVVRHNRHGGVFAGFTGDRFLGDTRAPHELATSLRLIEAGVPTAPVLAYALYDAGGPFRRADVVSQEIAPAEDLADVLVEGDDDRRRAALVATRRLLDSLTAAGARHHDLNIKNVLLRRTASGGPAAYVLDVDRVRFVSPREAARGNFERIARSARKWRDRYGATVSEADIDMLRPAPASARS